MSPAEAETWLAVARALEAAPFGDRRAAVERHASLLGVSVPTAYRRLAEVGHASGRKPRADKGTSKLDLAGAEHVALHVATGISKKGQCRTPVTEAVRHLKERGELAADLSVSTVHRRLRCLGLDRAAMTAQKSTIQRESSHPNHVWVVDTSVALAWFFRDEAGRRVLTARSEAELRSLYEGKREKLASLRQVLMRYVVTDHYTGAYFVWYYYEAGENSVSMADFLYRAMAKKGEAYASVGGEAATIDRAFPLSGVPRRILADQGAPFKSGLITSLLGEHGLNIKVELHAAGNAPASGSVESRHNWWQSTFETRLQYRPPPDLDTLNRWALEFAAERQRSIPHTRHGRPPMDLWATIEASELVAAPSRGTWLTLALEGEREATLTKSRYLQADKKTWEIRSPMAYGGQRVVFRIAPFTASGIRVWHPETREEFGTIPMQRNERSGFWEAAEGSTLGAPSTHRWDDAAAPGASHTPTPGQEIAAAVRAKAAPSVAVPDLFDALPRQLAERAELTVATPSRSWTPMHSASVGELLDSYTAREEIVRRKGQPLSREEGRWWRTQIGDGVTRARLDQLYAESLNAEAFVHAPVHAPPMLKVAL